MSVSRHYSEEEAAAILRLASQATVSGTVSRENLEAMASEIGLSAEALEQAEQKFLQEKLAQEEKERDRRERRRQFVNRLTTTLVAVGALAFFIAARNGGVSFSPAPIVALFVILLLTRKKSGQQFRRRMAPLGLFVRDGLDERTKRALDDIALTEPSKLQAVRELRDRLNLSLLDAKEAIDAYEVQNGRVFR